MEELIAELMSDLSTELENEVDYDENILAIKVKGAIRDVKLRRNYDNVGYSEKLIAKDLRKFYSNIIEIARYDYNKIGAEGHANYSEDGVSRTWFDRNDLFKGIVPLSQVC